MGRSNRQERNNQQQTRDAAAGEGLAHFSYRVGRPLLKAAKAALMTPLHLWRRWRRMRQRARAEAGKYAHLEIYGKGIIRLKKEYLASEEWRQKVRALQEHARRRQSRGV